MNKIVFIALLVMISSVEIQCQMRFEGYISSTVNINFDNGKGASGFLYSDSIKIYLVTAKHVLFEYDEITGKDVLLHDECDLTYFLIDSNRELEQINKHMFLDVQSLLDWTYTSKDSDIAIVELGKVKDSLIVIPNQKTKPLDRNSVTQFIYSKKDVISDSIITIGNQVFVFGYPRSVGLISRIQYDETKPLVRQGIIASKNTSNNTFIIDAVTFPGNSGGPVIQQYNLGGFGLIGLISETIPYSPNGGFSGNSGFTVVEPISELLKLIKEYENR